MLNNYIRLYAVSPSMYDILDPTVQIVLYQPTGLSLAEQLYTPRGSQSIASGGYIKSFLSHEPGAADSDSDFLYMNIWKTR